MEREKKITKKEVNAKKDYVVVNLYHERYSADLDITIHKNSSIVDIYNYYNFDENFDINKLERQGYHSMGYVYDKCGPCKPDDYALTKKECKRFKGYHIEALTIVELDKFIKEESFCALIMSTESKYGLVDYAFTPVDMHLNTHPIDRFDCYLYDKYEWYRKFKHFTWDIKSIPFKIKRKIKKKGGE